MRFWSESRTSLDELPQFGSPAKPDGPASSTGLSSGRFPSEFHTLRWRRESAGSLGTFYIRNRLPWLDLYILARTITIVLRGDGAY